MINVFNMYTSSLLTRLLLISFCITTVVTKDQNQLTQSPNVTDTPPQETTNGTVNSQDDGASPSANLEYITLIEELPPFLLQDENGEANPTSIPEEQSHPQASPVNPASNTTRTNTTFEIENSMGETSPNQTENIVKGENLTTTNSTQGESDSGQNNATSTPIPTLEIRTMIAELPPFLIEDSIAVPSSEQEVSTHEPVYEIRTINIELPPPELFWATPPSFYAEIMTPPSEETAWENAPVMRLATVFDLVEKPGMSFEDQVIAIEEYVGSTVCGTSGFQSSNARGRTNINTCYCDEMCAVLHNCCPDILIRNITSHDGGQGSECVETVPTGVNMSSIKPDDLMTMVTTCQDSTHLSEKNTELETISPDVISKCENYDPSDPMQTLPVSSKGTKITYRNIFCAQCNNVNITDTGNIYKWKASVKCANGMKKLLSGNPDTAEIYRRLNSKDGVMRTGCQLKYVAEELSGYDKKCKLNQSPSIDSCNQTGQWMLYDEKIDRACNMYTSIVFNEYKNMFCYLCNIDQQLHLDSLKEIVYRYSGETAHTARISFEALMDFSDSYVTKEEISPRAALCEDHQIYNNLTCHCQALMCSEGKGLSPNDDSKCTSVINSNYLGSRICLQIDLVFKLPLWEVDSLMDDISVRLLHCCFQALLHKVTVKSWCPGSKKVSLNADILDYDQLSYQTINQYDARAKIITSNSIEYSHRWLPIDQLESHAISLKTNCPGDYGITRPCINDREMTIFGRRRSGPLVNTIEEIENTVHFIDFTVTNLCPHVDLPANEFEIVNDTLYHIATRFEVESHQVDVVDNMTLRVCRDAFLSILSSVDTFKCINQSSHSVEDFDTWTIEGLVSIICTSLSLVCLFLTFLTYLIFPSLRDASGKNIMTLTLLLFLAQAFFEFTLEQFENETACTCFGILIHYFWLAAVFSMNACTMERFYKLCFPLRSRAFFYSRKPFIVASAYSLVSPLIIVGINILVNYEVTGHIGYGNSQICYIRELNSRIFGFAVPLAILLLANVILFAITIHTIRRQTVPGHKSSSTRIGIKACVQLSFVTGLTWLLAFLYDSISISELGYVFTALIGLQGVMFFYSIVLNKRVIALYRGLFGKKSQMWSGAKNNNSGSSGSTTRDSHGICLTKNHKQAYKISFTNQTFHSDVTKTSSGDSGVAF